VRFRAITREEFEALKQSKGHPDPAAAGTGPHTQSSGSAGEPV